MSDRTMDIQRAVTTYAQQMLTSIDGIKALLLDDETAGIIGLVSSQTEITKHDVYLVERLKAREKGDESQRHIKAIVYVRPTAENTILLRKELASPSFGEYYIYFSNTIRRTLLEDLADADVHSKVVEVKEYFADVYSLMPHLFHLKVNPCVGASRVRCHFRYIVVARSLGSPSLRSFFVAHG
uniref:Uncharacterized protein n=1 Tax=Rhodosorus marinus TaxID=101924 RepID=A0A7S3E5W9_9RHOD|mmetsp:Transcript_11382/g.47408  ORF Transcript_11382/g.47408 Transcript_11382/m.47408 type:complete len:183 (+) Transcript_11382:81-629(+)